MPEKGKAVFFQKINKLFVKSIHVLAIAEPKSR